MSRHIYPMPVITRAREHGEAGWIPRDISRFLEEEFDLTISEQTIRRWIDLDYAERQRECSRRGRSRMANQWGWRRRLDRIRELRGVGLAYRDVVKVVALDFGIELTVAQAERLARAEVGEDFARAILNCPRPSEVEAA